MLAYAQPSPGWYHGAWRLASSCRVDHARSGCSSSPRRVASLKTSARPLVWSRSWRIVISRLTWLTSGRNLPHGVVQAQPTFVDELEDGGRHERLRDAADDHLAARPSAD